MFLFIYFFGRSFTGSAKVPVVAIFGAGCAVSTLMANWIVPTLLPTLYIEDRWTVWKHILQTLFVLFCVSVGNQALLVLMYNEYPPFWQMYLSVTTIGFFPIIMSVFVTEQRRLKRNLIHAQTLNEQLAHRINLALETTTLNLPVGPNESVPADRIVLTSENGKDQLTLPPDQLLYIESIGNYIEVHWLNLSQPQKTVLRSTLKEIADLLQAYPHFFRCHRAFLVNLRAVSHSEGNARGYQLTLTGSPTQIPVSRSYVEPFDARMREFV